MILIIGVIVLVLITIETVLQIMVRYFRKDFQWLITEKDDFPDFDKVAFSKFIENSFDRELGWVRKANTTGIEHGKYGDIIYHVDNMGSRVNPVETETLIATFGDSYTFCRQVDDHQTWQVYLSEKIDNKVLNFGVGNYGVDQALLYYKRKNIPKATQVVILGFVPETICRIQSYWKHYLEFGNTFAFKPRFSLENGELKLHNNLVESVDDLENIDELIKLAKKSDYFYQKKFIKLQFRFPYLLKYLSNFKRNSVLFYLLIKKNIFTLLNINSIEVKNAPFSRVMYDNIKCSHAMYNDKNSCDLLESILISFRDMAYDKGHKPLLLVMPQLIDIKIINKDNCNPYDAFFSKINSKIPVLDMTSYLNRKNMDDLYSEDLYGGHLSELGNKLVANKLYDYFNKTSFF